MRFETVLGMRYVRAQKRHSILTVCSIMIAVALISMICNVYTTYFGIRRAASYEAAPYHVMFEDIDEVKAAEIRHMNQVASVEYKKNPNGSSGSAMVLFSEYIDDEYRFVENMIDKMHLNAYCSWIERESSGLVFNQDLMEYDMINMGGRANIASNFVFLLVFLLFFIFALRMIIDTAFEISSKERERQFGVLQSIGAEPKQIVRLLSSEGMILSVFGIPLGLLLGFLLSYLSYRLVLMSGIAEAFYPSGDLNKIISFHVSPLMLLLSAVLGFFWVFFSAYGTGMRIIKKSPLEAITARTDTVEKVRKNSLLSLLFGWKGKLAIRNAKRNPKRFVITVLSLTISLTLFAVLTNVFQHFKLLLLKDSGKNAVIDEVVPQFKIGLRTQGLSDDAASEIPEMIALLRDSGYFSNVRHSVHYFANLVCSDKKEKHVFIEYQNEEEYNKRFGDNAPITYEELLSSGGCILVNFDENDLPHDQDTVTVTSNYTEIITEAESERLENENHDDIHLGRINITDKEGNSTGEYYYFKTYGKEYDYPVITRCQANISGLDSNDLFIVLAEELWFRGDYKKYEELNRGSQVTCDLENETEYKPALKWIEAHDKEFEFDRNNAEQNTFGNYKKMITTLNSINTGFTFMMIMIGLIAIVNMINIISTGILNRKRELAALQCVGMTRGQMYGTTVIECLQFTLWAAVISSVLTVLMLFVTSRILFASELGEMAEITYIEPLVKIWAVSGIAFLCALLASFIPLQQMQKEPLVEQIRNIE